MGVSSSSLLRTTTEDTAIGLLYGGLAQLARAPALHAGGQRFESVILHSILETQDTEIFDILDTKHKQKAKWYIKAESIISRRASVIGCMVVSESRKGRMADA